MRHWVMIGDVAAVVGGCVCGEVTGSRRELMGDEALKRKVQEFAMYGEKRSKEYVRYRKGVHPHGIVQAQLVRAHQSDPSNSPTFQPDEEEVIPWPPSQSPKPRCLYGQ